MLLIHGEKDFLPSNPENTRLLASALPNAEVYILKNGGHMFFNKYIWQMLFRRVYIHITKLHVETRRK
jgi:pimeloyl-ACP methyl ester carboxylesterase